MLPSFALNTSINIRIVVVFPAPFLPNNPKAFPDEIEKETP